MLLKDKVVVINGIGPGLGKALARIAAQEGAKVVLGARNAAFLKEVCADINARGGIAIAVPCDISDLGQCERLAKAAADAFGGRIHGLINSAYYHGEWGFVENADEADWAKVYDVICLGTLRMTKACLPYLKGGGSIVNVSSMATVRPYGVEMGMEMGYAAAKGGVNVLTKYMAADLGKHGIRVNSCRLGWIYGDFVKQFIASEVAKGKKDFVANVVKDIPLGVLPPEDDCARAVLMMISDYAAVVTGAALDVNGGNWMTP